MRNNTFYILTGIVFVGIGFLSGYWIGNYMYSESAVQPTPAAVQTADRQIVGETVSIQTISPEPELKPYYLVKGEGDELCIYEFNGSEASKIKSFQVDYSMFPAEDRALLMDGIRVETREEAMSVIENFTS